MRDLDHDVEQNRLRREARLAHGPVCEEAEDYLGAECGVKHYDPPANVAHLAETLGGKASRPNHHERDDEETDEVREHSKSVVAESCAEHQLYQDDRG